MMPTKKQQRTIDWKTQQLRNSIKELCDEAMEKRKKAALEDWKNKNKKDPNTERKSNNSGDGGKVSEPDREV